MIPERMNVYAFVQALSPYTNLTLGTMNVEYFRNFSRDTTQMFNVRRAHHVWCARLLLAAKMSAQERGSCSPHLSHYRRMSKALLALPTVYCLGTLQRLTASRVSLLSTSLTRQESELAQDR